MEPLLGILKNTVDEMRSAYETASDCYNVDVPLERGLEKLRQTEEISRIEGLGFLSNWLVQSTSDRGFDLMVLDRIEGQKSLARASAVLVEAGLSASELSCAAAFVPSPR